MEAELGPNTDYKASHGDSTSLAGKMRRMFKSPLINIHTPTGGTEFHS